MKISLKLITGFCLLLLVASSFKGSETAPVVGAYAPHFKIHNNDTTTSLGQYRGSFVVLSFWAASDAQSRLRCNELTSAVNELSNENSNIEMLSLNLDRSEKLFNEIVRRDNLSTNSQFYVSGADEAQLRVDYDLNRKGFNSFLIAPNGKILAVNPTKTQMKQLIEQNNFAS